MTPREIAGEYWRCVKAGDWEGWLDLFSADIVMEETVSGSTHGIAELRERIESYFTAGFNRFLDYPRELVIEGNTVMAVVQIEAETVKGAEIDCPGAVLFKVRDGKIYYLTNFHNTLPFATALKE